jgi:catechol 2,3-dioxygenase-like lactoylglutathione lyase family enzyme
VTPKPVEEAPASDAGIRHICFDVTDIDSEVARLKAAGVRFVSEPQYVAPTIRSVYARDPDGNIVEFQEILPGGTLERGHVHR